MHHQREEMDRLLASVERRAFRMAEIATGSREDALDMVQESMFRLVQRYGGRPAAEWRPLFFRIVQNLIRDWHRRRWLRRGLQRLLPPAFGGTREPRQDDAPADPLDVIPDHNQPALDAALMDRQAMTALEGALRRLPPRQSQVFLLRLWEGLSVEETAGVMGISAGSVKTHYSRAVASLRKRLEDHRP